MAIFDANGRNVMALKSGEMGSLIVDSTIFFAEQGGQLYDTGTFRDSLDVILYLRIVRISKTTYTTFFSISNIKCR